MPEATEADHHGRPSFRVGGRIFATLWDDDHVNVMLDEPGIRTAVQAHPDACEEFWWGRRLGAVHVRIGGAGDALLAELLTDAWESKAPKRLLHETARLDPRVDDYIAALPDWQQVICRQVRDLVHAADPDVEETIKRRVQPYFVLRGNICALRAAKDHVCVFLYDGAIVPDPEKIITGGHDNATARQISIHEGEAINATALKAMFAQIAANNRNGGWRKLKAAAPPG